MTRAILRNMVMKGCGCRFPDIDWPYYFDAAGFPNGTMPYPWVGATFTISGGVAINTPILGGEKLTDTGLEVNYTAGLCDTLTLGGAPAVAQSADVHGGAKAQLVTSAAFNDRLNWPLVPGTTGAWYLYSVWTKRTAGVSDTLSSRLYQSGMIPASTASSPINTAGYTQHKMTGISTGIGNVFCYPHYETGGAPWRTGLADDGSLQIITGGSQFAILPINRANAIIKCVPSPTVDQSHSALIGRANLLASPTDFIFATWRWRDQADTYILVSLCQCIVGVYTVLVAEVALDIVSGAWLELRMNGNQAKLFYNAVQVGGDQVITASGLFHGLAITGGNTVKQFYATNELIAWAIGWAGSSNTASLIGHRVIAQADLLAYFPQYDFTFTNIATSGWATWPNLVNLSDLTASNLIIFDQSNDDFDDTAHVEAFIRNAWIGKQIVSIVLPAWVVLADNQVTIPYNQLAMEQHLTLCAVYGVIVINFWQYCMDNVPAPYHLADLYADTAHLTALGYSIFESMLDDYLPIHGTNPSAILPARVYASSADFQQVPIIKFGINFDARAGVWVDTGNSTASVTPGSTITYSGTFRSFGCFNAAAVYPNVSVVIDADPPINPFSFYANGYDYGVRAAHTIVITVLTTCTIDEFWAI